MTTRSRTALAGTRPSSHAYRTSSSAGGSGQPSSETKRRERRQFDLPVPPYLSRNTVRFGDESWIEVTAVPDDTPSDASRIPSIG